jgi:RimJ/RimL family protein N-acetyltransferase
MDPTELVCGDLVLRPLRADDAEAVLAGWDDDEVARWQPPRDRPRTLADARERVGRSERERADRPVLRWAVAEGDAAGPMLGEVSIDLSMADLGIGLVGWWLLPAGRGRGLASRAVRLLARYAFTELGLARLEAGIATGNTASLAVAERAGWAREGIMRSGFPARDGRVDTWLVSRIPSDG